MHDAPEAPSEAPTSASSYDDLPTPAGAAAPGAPPPRPAAPEPDPATQLKAIADAIKAEVGRIFMGRDHIIEALLIALLTRGHVLLEGVPGVAKTTLVRAFAQTLDVSFRRIQFTPDLMPSDITGVYIPNLQTQEFVLRRGPIFANVVLGDEINRAPAKTQSALLEAMQERQVTIEGETHVLGDPFMVLATQNPLEQEGVYALPEAQLDRFLIKLIIGYPSAEQELTVLQTHQRAVRAVEAVARPEQVLQLRAFVDGLHVDDELAQYIIRLARFTREHPQVELGASPRAALALFMASKARAALHGRAFVLPDDIRALIVNVWAHRLILQPEAELSGVAAEDILRQALQKIRYAKA